jgi:quercetin dioxygenase-like cupin family protein
MQPITADQLPVAANPHGVDVRHLHATAHVMISQITLEPGEAVQPHNPPVDACFYVLQGTPTFVIDGNAMTAGPDTLIPTDPSHVHALKNEGTERARILVIKTPNPRA